MTKLVVRRYRDDDRPAIERLNGRLGAWDVPHPVFGEETSSGTGGRSDGAVRERLFVAAEADEIRGAVWLREHDFWVDGRRIVAGWVKYPVAESLISARYRGVPASLVLHLVREQPRLMALGLGGREGVFARFLTAMGWTGTLLPFHFYMVHPARVLREVRRLRRTRARRLASDLLAGTGLGWAGFKLLSRVRSGLGSHGSDRYEAWPVDRFGDWADQLWGRYRDRYGFLAVRDTRMLGAVYSPSLSGLARLRVRRDAEDVGWVTVLRQAPRPQRPDDPFGRLVVGLIADGFAAPEHARGVLAGGMRYLTELDVDLIFSNQSHPAWNAALKSLGFLEGPSNFAFFRSPGLEAELAAASVKARGWHVNRGDCDGPRWR